MALLQERFNPVVPPKVEYTITDKGRETIPKVEVFRDSGLKMMRKKGLDTSKDEKKETTRKKR